MHGGEMDDYLAEYLLSMAASNEAMQTGLLREIVDTVPPGALRDTYAVLKKSGCFELSPKNEVVTISPHGFELLRELRSRARARARELRRRQSSAAGTSGGTPSGVPHNSAAPDPH